MRTVDVGGLTIGDGHPPRIMGVLNVSTESGYAPSVYGDPAAAARYVERELVDEGADIVDVGLQSANPKYDTLPPAVELDRLDAAVEVIDRVEADVPFSIETRYAAVADEAVAQGFDVVNDVCGFADPAMPDVCEDHDVPVIKMASPPDLERPGALTSVDEVFAALERGGFTDRTIIDPAFGGWCDEKTYEDDRAMFRRLREFRAFGRPILTATNREDFLGEVVGRDTPGQLPVSLAAAALEVDRGSHVIRTHDVAETRDVALVTHALRADRAVDDGGAVRITELEGVTRREAERHLALRGGDPGRAPASVALAFTATGLAADERATLADAADEHEVVVAGGEAATYLGGDAVALRRVADRVSGASDGLTALAGSVRRAAARRVD